MPKGYAKVGFYRVFSRFCDICDAPVHGFARCFEALIADVS
jgi:hypothetical protein